MKNPRIFFIGSLAAMMLAGPANGQAVHLYTPDEQAGISADGSIATMTTPSELRELFENGGRVPKPTGHVTYCNAGLMGRGARAKAMQAISNTCGGANLFTVLRAGPMVDAVKTFVGTSCVRSEMIVFRCDGSPPAND